MRLTRQTEIAISILLACARTRGWIVQTRTVTANCGTAGDHPAQVVSCLTHIGWLENHRSRGGGLTLAEGMERLTVGKIVCAFQPQRKERHVFPPGLDRLLNETERVKFDYLDRFTVADLVGDATAARCPGVFATDMVLLSDKTQAVSGRIMSIPFAMEPNRERAPSI